MRPKHALVTGNINEQGSDAEAKLRLKVIGERRTVNATVNLSYRNNSPWRVTDASYQRDGQVIELRNSNRILSSAVQPCPPAALQF